MRVFDSDFCVKLFATFQDKFNVYFLMEPVMGCTLLTIMRREQRLSDKTAAFYAACVVLALEYLHSSLNVIFRNVKPENIMIGANGLVDFGCAKVRDTSCTLCGISQYLAPEMIQNLPQGFAVDWWSVGVLMHEMVVGRCPFEGDEQMKMFEKILRVPCSPV